MRHTVPALTATAVGLSLVISGCTSDSGPFSSDNDVDSIIEGLVENAIEGSTGDDVDVDFGSSGGDASGPGVPIGFPSELPIPAGELFSALKINNYYTLSFEGSELSEATALVDYFLSNGHTITNEVEWDQTKGWLLSGTYEVNISHGYDADGLAILSYSVTVPE